MTNRLLFIAAFVSFATALRAEDAFVPLFDGKTLTGWEQHSGKAEYRVENGVIVGKTVPDTNSGIQFRSNYYTQETEVEIAGKKKKFPADRVHGYQFEIDPSPRAFTGGVYDEGRRGWLFDLKNNEAARKAFKQGEWNLARIECRGSSIKTFLNGVPAADFADEMTAEGVIALQVHGIGKKTEAVGKEVMWKNIRIQELK
ncbi:MAG: hypothetical protein B7Z37_14965 [Verrucomicrobia bacterium 12-59-8]|nr:MAG: hypothetical protein B7Z37_14965 [Verrucomicrobia bacterium 12-59-8]